MSNLDEIQFTPREIAEAARAEVFCGLQVRPGVINRGYDFEDQITAFIVLNLIQDENVKAFELKLNSSPYGKFDDLILGVEYEDGENEKFAIQLKHREEQNSILQAPREFNRRDSRGKGKAFNISEYEKEHIKVDGYKLILYTNARFENIDKVNYYNITSCSGAFRTNLFHVDGIYKFEKLQNPRCSNFYDNFFLLSKQKNVEDLHLAIKNIFKEKYFCDNEHAIKIFLDFFRGLRKGDYNTTKINRDEVILHLTSILLFNYIITPSVTQDCSVKLELLEKAIKKFDATIVLGQKRDIIHDKWKMFLSEPELQRKLNLATNLKFLTKSEEASTEKLSKILGLIHGPLFLHLTCESQKTINSIAPLIKTLETLKLNFVLIGETVPEVTFQPLTTFENLEDLANEEFYQEFLKFFEVSLQGRRPESMMKLKEIGFDLKLITPSEIFQLLEGDLKVGQETEELPKFYIPRTLECRIRSEQSLNVGSDVVILTDKNIVEQIESSFYHFKLNENILVCAQNRVDLDHKNSFENSLNILYGDPGAGKTTIMKYLASRYPSNHLVVRIPAHKINLCFNSDKHLGILKQFSIIREASETDRRICTALLEEKKVVLLFDGLNEVKKDSLDEAIRGIRHFSREGYKIWISSTLNLKEYLESTLRISCSYIIEDLTTESQMKYIYDNLKKSEIREDIINATIQKIFKENVKEILKLPLILYLLTEILRTHPKILYLKEDLTLNQMYCHFFEGQVKHYIQKQGFNQFKELMKLIETFQMYQLRFYQIAALKTCLLPTEFEQLGLKMEKKNFNSMKEDGDPLNLIEINQDDTFTFRHQTFSEYFAASWLSENYTEIPIEARSFILKAKYDGIRKFFDQDMAERCPLHLAVLDEDLKRIEEYVKKHIKDVDKAGRTVLHVAVSMGKTYAIGNIDYENKHNYKVQTEKSTQQKEILKLLLEASTEEDLLRKDEFFQWNAFEYADASSCVFALKELSKKRKVSWDYFALRRLNMTTIKTLLPTFIKQASFITLPSLLNINNIEFALRMYHLKLAKLMIEKGANVNIIDDKKKLPLHKKRAFNEHAGMFLFEERGNVDEVNVVKRGPLQRTIETGHYEFVKYLLENVADINAFGKVQNTSLHYAAYEGHKKIVKYFLEKKVHAEDEDKKTAKESHTSQKDCNRSIKLLILVI